MIIIKHLSKNFAQKEIFNKANLTLYSGEIMCLMGSNGAGKSTLFKMIQGLDTEYHGDIEINQNLTIMDIPQELPQSSLGLFDYICEGLDFSKLLKELEALEEKMAEGQTDEKTLAIYGEKRSLFEQNGGYNIIYDVKKVLEGLDFPEEEYFHRPINTLSGGEARRALLAKALIQQADILLLDEPTNHLDLKNIHFLESFLKKSSSTVLFISHDIEFIENTANVIVSLSQAKLDRFEGSYSEYLKYVDETNAKIDKQSYEMRQEINTLRPTALKFQAGTRSAQAQSLFRRIDKLEESIGNLGSKIIFEKPIRLSAKVFFEKAINPMLSIDNAPIMMNNEILIDVPHVRINEKEHWALLGQNGAGKTTFIRALESAYQEKNSHIRFSRNVSLGIYKQEDMEFFKGQEKMSTLDYIRKRFLSTYDETNYHKFLKEFHIMPHLSIESISGGEKSKLRLLCLLLTGFNLLILDEPTNHMDIASVQGLCNILKDYKGSIILITHDRKILRILKPELFVIQNKTLSIHDKDELNSTLKHLSSYNKTRNDRNPKQKVKLKEKALKKTLTPNKLKYLEKEQEKTLHSLEKIENQVKELTDKQFLPEIYENNEKYKQIAAEIVELKLEHNSLYQYLEEINDELNINNAPE